MSRMNESCHAIMIHITYECVFVTYDGVVSIKDESGDI